MFQRFRCCECYRVQNSSLSQQVLSKFVEILVDGSNPNLLFYFINIFPLYLSFGSILNSIFTRIGQILFINGT